jgi:hypothetical protein
VTQYDLALRVARLRPTEATFGQSLRANPQSRSVPDEDLQAIALGIAEQEQVPAQRLTRQSIPDQTVQPLEPLAHVGDAGGQIDPCGWTQAKHGLHPLQCTHQALQRIRIKTRVYLDPAPARKHHGQPATRFVLRQRFLGGQLHFHQPADRRNWFTPSLPTSLLQMAIQRAEAHTATAAKLAASHAAARKLRH